MLKFFLSIISIYYIVVIGGLFGANFVNAQGPIVITSPFSGTIMDVIDRIIGFLVTAAIPITVIMILVGSFQMLTAGGNAEQFRKGTKTIMYAVIGFTLVLLSRGSITLIRELITGS